MRLLAATIDGLATAQHLVDQINEYAEKVEADGYTVLGFNFDTVSRTYNNMFEGTAFIVVQPPAPAAEAAPPVVAEAVVAEPIEAVEAAPIEAVVIEAPTEVLTVAEVVKAATPELTPISSTRSRRGGKKTAAAA